MKQIQAQSGANVIVGKLATEGFRRVCLSGDPSSQTMAKELIEKFVKTRQEQATTPKEPVTTKGVVEVPDRFVRMERIRAVTGVNVEIDKECLSDTDTRNVTLTGTEEAIAAARNHIEIMLLDLYRRSGIFNAPLEEKLAAETTQVSALDLTRIPTPLQNKMSTLGLDGSAPGVPVAPIMGQTEVPFAPKSQYAMPPPPVVPVAPASYHDILPCAVHFAKDPAYVEYYRMLKDSTIQG